MPSSYVTWLRKYNILKEYYANNGSIDSLTSEVIDREVISWLAGQRNAYKNTVKSKLIKEHVLLLNKLFFDWSPKDTIILNDSITFENKGNYNSILINRVNNIINDLVYEGIDIIDSTNQKDIEKIMIKRIWR